MALLATLGAVGGAMAVPDARITVDGLDLSSSEPTVGERTALNLTVANSGGSPAAADVTDVRLLDDDGETLDEASTVGALSAGDSADVELWTRFDEPGEQRLTVEVVVTQSTDGDSVTVTRDTVVDVQPSESELNLRTRALDPADLESDDDGDGGFDAGGLDGIFGAGGGGLDANDEEETVQSADSPVAVTVVNTGTTIADRVSLTASGAPTAAGDGVTEKDGDVRALSAGPFVVEDVAPGEERRVVVDLGPLERQSNVTFTASYRSGTDRQDGVAADRTVESIVAYPARTATPTVTDASVQPTGDESVLIDANLGNAGSGELEGAVVSVADGPGVSPTPAGGEYFVGTLGASDFVGFDLRADANASAIEEIPIRIEYTERGVRYTETATVALSASGESDSGSDGALGSLGDGTATSALLAVGLGGTAVFAFAAAVRRRDV